VLGERHQLLAAVRLHHGDLGHPFSQAQGGLHRFGQPLADAVAAHQAVDHHLDGVLLVPGQVHA